MSLNSTLCLYELLFCLCPTSACLVCSFFTFSAKQCSNCIICSLDINKFTVFCGNEMIFKTRLAENFEKLCKVHEVCLCLKFNRLSRTLENSGSLTILSQCGKCVCLLFKCYSFAKRKINCFSFYCQETRNITS